MEEPPYGMTQLKAKRTVKSTIPCLESHMPLDLVIIMLGTNDQTEI